MNALMVLWDAVVDGPVTKLPVRSRRDCQDHRGPYQTVEFARRPIVSLSRDRSDPAHRNRKKQTAPTLPVASLLPRYEPYLPSAAAFGLAWVFHWYYGLLFFLGALVAFLLERRKPKLAEEFTLPVASGVVAGGSLMGVALVFWANGGSIFKTLFGG